MLSPFDTTCPLWHHVSWWPHVWFHITSPLVFTMLPVQPDQMPNYLTNRVGTPLWYTIPTKFLTNPLEVYMAFIFWHSIWYYFWRLLWHSFWHFFWHLFLHSFWHSISYLFWHSIWHPFWHSVWHLFWRVFLAFWHMFRHSIWHFWWHFPWHLFGSMHRCAHWIQSWEYGSGPGVPSSGAGRRKTKRRRRSCTFVKNLETLTWQVARIG